MLRVGLAYLYCDPVPSGELPRIYVVWSADTFNCAQDHQSGHCPHVPAVENVGINAEIQDLLQHLSTSGNL